MPAPRAPVDEWANMGLDSKDMQAWIEAGLGQQDFRIAAQCKAAGLTPNDLTRRVDGFSAGARLRGGESLTSVRLRIREQQVRDFRV